MDANTLPWLIAWNMLLPAIEALAIVDNASAVALLIEPEISADSEAAALFVDVNTAIILEAASAYD